jgi:hypothetical protein
MRVVTMMEVMAEVTAEAKVAMVRALADWGWVEEAW